MKKNLAKPTVVLNKTSQNGFIDFDSPSDLAKAIKALNKIRDGEKHVK
ncbi:hypothetical protein [Methanobrevibacter sp.]